MSTETIIALCIALVPSTLSFIAERNKNQSSHSVSVFDRQQEWIVKLEEELDERDKEIEELKLMIKILEERIEELERKDK